MNEHIHTNMPTILVEFMWEEYEVGLVLEEEILGDVGGVLPIIRVCGWGIGFDFSESGWGGLDELEVEELASWDEFVEARDLAVGV